MQRFEKVTTGRALSRSNQDIACDLIVTLPEELPQILSPQVSKARACRGRIATFVPFQLSGFFEVESLSTIRATLCYHRGSLFQCCHLWETHLPEQERKLREKNATVSEVKVVPEDRSHFCH